VTVDQLKALPPVVSAEVAFAALGVGRSLGYHLIKNGQFPVPVLRLGRIIKIPTAPLLELLGSGSTRLAMDPSNGAGRVARQPPGPFTTPPPPVEPPPGIVAEEGVADPSVSHVPGEGPERLAWLAAFQRAVADDAAATRATMVSSGWAEAEARAAHHDWWHTVIEAALDRGWPA
jgi:hypothetical protein